MFESKNSVPQIGIYTFFPIDFEMKEDKESFERIAVKLTNTNVFYKSKEECELALKSEHPSGHMAIVYFALPNPVLDAKNAVLTRVTANRIKDVVIEGGPNQIFLPNPTFDRELFDIPDRMPVSPRPSP